MSAMSDLSAITDQLIATLSAADLHRLAERLASQIGCVIVPDPTSAGAEAAALSALQLQGPVTRLAAKAGQYRAMAEGFRKKYLQGRPGVSVQDAQNADRFAEDLETVLKGLAEAQNAAFAARLYAGVVEELLRGTEASQAGADATRDLVAVELEREEGRA